MSQRVAIVTDEPGWHGARLQAAFAARGCAVTTWSLRDCRLAAGPADAGVIVPMAGLPDAVFVRGVAGGSLEEVVFRLNVLHALQAEGVVVYNDGRAIERSVDKAYTSYLLARAGLPTPPTWIVESAEQARALTRRETAQGEALVCKPLFGSQGKDLVLVRGLADLPAAEAVHGVWYLQRYLPTAESGSTDWRVFVIGGRAVAAAQRSAAGWPSNVARGGRCHAALPDAGVRGLAETAAELLGMGYAGVDLLRDRCGVWWVLEVNSIPAWRGLQQVTELDIAGLLADDLLRRCAPAVREVAS